MRTNFSLSYPPVLDVEEDTGEPIIYTPDPDVDASEPEAVIYGLARCQQLLTEMQRVQNVYLQLRTHPVDPVSIRLIKRLPFLQGAGIEAISDDTPDHEQTRTTIREIMYTKASDLFPKIRRLPDQIMLQIGAYLKYFTDQITEIKTALDAGTRPDTYTGPSYGSLYYRATKLRTVTQIIAQEYTRIPDMADLVPLIRKTCDEKLGTVPFLTQSEKGDTRIYRCKPLAVLQTVPPTTEQLDTLFTILTGITSDILAAYSACSTVIAQALREYGELDGALAPRTAPIARRLVVLLNNLRLLADATKYLLAPQLNQILVGLSYVQEANILPDTV